ncbi:hypothetical protein [Marinomonas piezotolerans]|uniref:hypothetical protein n=1 Tax=Marinomonas piezotolerans TaxID=2213058 RepID=UPI001314E7C5|nr:hypothetical protein [Marinomonas piezotolerans]
MEQLSRLYCELASVLIADISQAPTDSQPELIEQIEELQDSLKAILRQKSECRD